MYGTRALQVDASQLLNRRHYEPPDVNRGRRRKCCPSAVQPNCQRSDIAEDEERRLRTRTLCRWLLLVEGHRPPPAEGRQLHQRAESFDVGSYCIVNLICGPFASRRRLAQGLLLPKNRAAPRRPAHPRPPTRRHV